MRRIAHAQNTPHRQQARHLRRQRADIHEHRLPRRKPARRVCGIGCRCQSQRLENFGAGHAARVPAHAMHQHRHALARQQQRQQRRQVGDPARTVVTRDNHRRVIAGRRDQCGKRRFGGLQETADFLDRLTFYPHGQQNGAQFQIRYPLLQHGRIQQFRVLARQAAGAILAAPNFLDETRGRQRRLRVGIFYDIFHAGRLHQHAPSL